MADQLGPQVLILAVVNALQALFQDERRVASQSRKIRPEEPASIRNDKDITDFIHLLGCHPVAILHCTAYIKHHGLTINQFKERYRRDPAAIHRAENIENVSGMTIHTRFAPVLATIEAKDKNALALLELTSLLSREPISLSFFQLPQNIQWPQADGHFRRICTNKADLETAVDILVEHSLVQKSGNSISVVQIVQSYVYHSLSAPERARVRAMCNTLLEKRMPEIFRVPMTPERRIEAEMMAFHVDAIAENIIWEHGI